MVSVLDRNVLKNLSNNSIIAEVILIRISSLKQNMYQLISWFVPLHQITLVLWTVKLQQHSFQIKYIIVLVFFLINGLRK